MDREGNFDVSLLSYSEFINYLFTAPEGELWNRDPNGREFWFREMTHPETVVGHLTRFCLEFGAFVETLPLETIDRGNDGMLNEAFLNLETALWDDSVPLDERVDCIRSMYRVFADFVVKCQVEVLPGSFYMWWDHVCGSFWHEQKHSKKLAAEDYDLLPEQDRKIVDAMFEILTDILKLDDKRTKSCALHGLGHLHHPGVQRLVQDFINTSRDDLSETGLAWLEQCRDGTVM